MSTGHGSKMDRLQERAIAALLAHSTIERAAASVNLDESTLRSWLKDLGFSAAYRAARADFLERTVDRLVAASVEAVETLRRNLTAARAADQIRAAGLILSHSTNGLAVHDVAEQLAALRAELEDLKSDERCRTPRDQAIAGGDPGPEGGYGWGPGPAAGGPDGDYDRGGDYPRPVAGDVAPLF